MSDNDESPRAQLYSPSAAFGFASVIIAQNLRLFTPLSESGPRPSPSLPRGCRPRRRPRTRARESSRVGSASPCSRRRCPPSGARRPRPLAAGTRAGSWYGVSPSCTGFGWALLSRAAGRFGGTVHLPGGGRGSRFGVVATPSPQLLVGHHAGVEQPQLEVASEAKPAVWQLEAHPRLQRCAAHGAARAHWLAQRGDSVRCVRGGEEDRPAG